MYPASQFCGPKREKYMFNFHSIPTDLLLESFPGTCLAPWAWRRLSHCSGWMTSSRLLLSPLQHWKLVPALDRDCKRCWAGWRLSQSNDLYLLFLMAMFPLKVWEDCEKCEGSEFLKFKHIFFELINLSGLEVKPLQLQNRSPVLRLTFFPHFWTRQCCQCSKQSNILWHSVRSLLNFHQSVSPLLVLCINVTIVSYGQFIYSKLHYLEDLAKNRKSWLTPLCIRLG